MMREDVKQNFAARFSVEATRPTADEIGKLRDVLPRGNEVYLIAIPKFTEDDLVLAAKRLREAGLEPVVHIAARMLPDANTLSNLLARLRGEANVRRLLVIGGDAAQAGPYP